MRKRIVRVAFVIVAVVLATTGCKLPFWSELYGAWVATFGSDTSTLEFAASTMTMVNAGSMNGEAEFTFDEVDEPARHILMTATSISGDLVGMLDLGSVWYLTYEITADTLYIGLDDAGYPATPTMGPFEKQ
jgi:hypothetical protein